MPATTTPIPISLLTGGQRVAINGDYSANGNDSIIAITSTSAPLTITLPDPTTVGATSPFNIVDESGTAATNTITVAAPIGYTINGLASVDIVTNYGSLSIYSTGLNYFTSVNNAGVAKPQISATGTITTTSTSDVLATSMTSTPEAGTYLVYFTGAIYIDSPGSGYYANMSIYAGGSICTPSQIEASDSVNYQTPFCCIGLVTVNGSQAIEGRWRRSSSGCGTAYMLGTRTLTLLKVA